MTTPASIMQEIITKLQVPVIMLINNSKYDFMFNIGDGKPPSKFIPFYGQFSTWEEHKDEIIELLRRQIKENKI